MKITERYEQFVNDLMKLKSLTKTNAEQLARQRCPDMAKLATAEKSIVKFDYKADRQKREEDKALLIAEKRIKAAEENLIRQAESDLEKLKKPFTQKVEKRIFDLMNDGRQISKTRAVGEVMNNFPYEWKQAQEEKRANG